MLLEKIKQFFKQTAKFIPIAITIASCITAITPNPINSDAIALAHQILDIIALNVGHNEQQGASTTRQDVP